MVSFYSPEGQTLEMNIPRLKPVLPGPWFSLRLYERFCLLALSSFPRLLPAFFVGVAFIDRAMTLTSDLSNGRGFGKGSVESLVGSGWSEPQV